MKFQYWQTELEGRDVVGVDLHTIKDDKSFWEMLSDNLQKVQAFYETQLSSFLEQFHTLTLQAILLNQLEEYIPFNPGQATKLERELGRLPNTKDVPIGVLGVDQVAQRHPIAGNSRFITLNKFTNIEEVKSQLKKLRAEETAKKSELNSSHKSPIKSLLSKSFTASGAKQNPLSNMTTISPPDVYENFDRHPKHRRRGHPRYSSNQGNVSIEDHVRDFHFASAKSEQYQDGWKESRSVSDVSRSTTPNPYDFPVTFYPQQLNRNNNQALPNGYNQIHRRDTSNNYNQQRRANSQFNEDEDSEPEILLRSRNNPNAQSPRITVPPLAVSSLQNSSNTPRQDQQILSHSLDETHHSARTQSSSLLTTRKLSSELQNERDKMRHDDFFEDTSDEEEDILIRQGATMSLNKIDLDDDEDGVEEAELIPVQQQRRSASLASIESDSDNKRYLDSGRSSFFGSDYGDDEDDVNAFRGSPKSDNSPRHLTRSQEQMNNEPIADRRDVYESDGAEEKSSDSGYASGGSADGFVDDHEAGNEEHDHVPRRTAPSDGDTETTGSRHHHVPETRLKTHHKHSEGQQEQRSQTDTNGQFSEASIPVVAMKSSASAYSLLDLKNQVPIAPKDQERLSHSSLLRVSNLKQSETAPGSSNDSSIVSKPNNLPSPFVNGPSPQLSRNEIEMDNFQNGRARISNDGVPLVLNVQENDVDQKPDNQEEFVQLDLEAPPPRTTFYRLPDFRTLDKNRAIKELQAGFSELYRGLHLLKRFSELNVEATDKVLAKYDKNIERGFRSTYLKVEMPKYEFTKAAELKALISQTEYVYAQAFTDGHRTPAMSRLRVPKDEEDMETTTLRFGFLFGMSLGFVLIILYMCFVVRASVVAQMRPDLIVYRMLFVVTLMFWYWGVDMWIWSSYRVNYPFIFDFNTRGHMRYQNVFDIASVFTIVLISDMMLYMITALQRYDPDFIVPGFEFLGGVAPSVYPLVLVILLLALLLFYSVKSHFWLARTMGRIITAPLYKVVFRDFFLADQLVSISIVLQDIDFTICYFATDAFRGGGNACASNHLWMMPILSVLPQLWRLLQCLRRYRDSKDVAQLQNAGKYATGMAVAVCSSLRSIFKNTVWLVFWLIVAIVATFYSYIWDIWKDWSIGDRKSSNWLLRDQLLYPKWWYYVAAIVNLALRLMWTLTISPDVVASFFGLGKDGFTTLLVAVEVSRRAMWNVFRVENEQLTNCGKFRAIQDIPLPLPLRPAVEDELYTDKIK